VLRGEVYSGENQVLGEYLDRLQKVNVSIRGKEQKEVNEE